MDVNRVARSNVLAQRVATATRKIGYVLTGREPVLYLTGDPGVGKTHMINAAMAETNRRPIIRKPANFGELLDVFEESDGTTPIVLEEIDHIFASPRMVNIIKIATDIEGHRYEVVRKTVKGRKTEKRIDLSAPLIMTSNRDLTDETLFPASQRAHIAALVSRSQPIYLTASKRDAWEYSCYLALAKGSLDKRTIRNRRGEIASVPVPLATRNLALEWFTRNLNRLDDGYPRTLRVIRDAIDQHPRDPDLYNADLEDRLVNPRARDFEVDEVPQLSFRPLIKA